MNQSPPRTPRRVTWLIGLPLLAAAILYWPVLRLPNIYDTLLHIRIASTLDWRSVWLPTEAFGFYRPLTFLPFIAIREMLGHYPAWLLNGINWVQHSANAALLAWLVWRLWRKPVQTALSGIFFALYPFSYQAVAVYGHNVHPQAVLFMLLGLHAVLSAQRARSAWRWRGLTALLFVLALLNHESAVLFGALAALVVVGNWGAETGEWGLGIRAWRALLLRLREPALWVAAGLAYLIAYQFLPISAGPQAVTAEAGLGLKLLYVLQGAAYPLAWFGQWAEGVSAKTVTLLAVALTVGFSALAAQRVWPALLVSWGWWLLAAALIVIPLPAGYVVHGPRLLYLSSVGAALLWATLLDALAAQRRASQAVALVAVLVIVVTNWLFVSDRLRAYADLTGGIPTLRQTLLDAPPDTGVLLLNLPDWIAPPRPTYRVGVEFVQQLGFYLFTDEWVRHNVGAAYPVQALRSDALLTDVPYGHGIHVETSLDGIVADWHPGGSEVMATLYDEAGSEMVRFGRFQPHTTSATLATIPPYTVHAATATVCAGQLDLAVTWTVDASLPPQPTLSAFVQALAADGTLIAQADGPPLRLRPDLVTLPADWEMQDARTLAVGDAAPATLLLGLYDFASGERLPAQDSAGATLPDNALRLPITDRCP